MIIVIIFIVIILIVLVGIYLNRKKVNNNDTLEKIVEELKQQKTICNVNLASLQISITKIQKDIDKTNSNITSIKQNVRLATEQYLNQYKILIDKYYYIIKYFIDKFPTISYKYKKLISTPLTYQTLNTLFDEFYDSNKHLSQFEYSTEFYKLLFKEFENFEMDFLPFQKMKKLMII